MLRVSSIIFWAIISLIASGVLYHTSYRCQDMERKITDMQAEITAHHTQLHVLKAEWAHLTNPERIAIAAVKHLDLRPTAAQQLALSSTNLVLPQLVAEVTPHGTRKVLHKVAEARPTATPAVRIMVADRGGE